MGDQREYEPEYRAALERLVGSFDRPQTVTVDMSAVVNTAIAAAVSHARQQVATAVIDEALRLQAVIDDDPEYLGAHEIAGEIEGLWSAAQIADESTYFRRRAERPTAKPEATDD